jgi:hypothetical protein
MSSPTTLGSIAQNLLTSIEEVLSAFVTDIQNYAGVIADLLIGVLVGYATVKFGRRIFNAISGWISDLMP